MRRLAAIAGLLACAVALAATPASASVATLPFEEAFGPAEQPLFNRPGALAFEAAAGDLIVAERSAVNEEQELRIEAASGLGGTYELSFAGQTTGWEGEATLPAAGQAGSGDLLGAEGTGTVTARSDEITGVDTTSGAFAVGQEVEVLFERGYVRTFQETKIVEINGTTIKLSRATDGEIGVSEVRAIRAGSTTVSNFSGPFAAGQAISGTGIQDGTTITAVGAGTLTLSKVAVDTASGVSLLAGPAGASSILTASGALVSGERISGPGIQPGTVVSNVNEGAGTFTLSKPVTAAGPAAGLAADLPYDARAITVAAALKKLPALGDNLSGDKSRARPDNEFSPIVRAVEFTGTLAAKPAELISCDGSGLTGTAPTCSVSELNHGRRAGLYRYHADGTPAPFATLGTNVIDGMRGYGGKPCAEEPSSCDETPQGQLNLNEQAFGLGVAIDESGTATDGDIYVTQGSAKVVDVFAPDGHYLGQLSKYTEAGKEKTLGELSGVAVDDSGALYVADRSKSKIRKFVSQGAPHDPLVDADNTANFNTVLEPTSLAVGTGPTAGSLFATSGRGPVAKLDAATGTEQYKIVTEEYYGAGGVAVNTANGRLFVAMQSELTVREYDASGALAATLLAQTPPIGPQWAAGIAVDPSSGKLHLTLDFGERGQRYVETYGDSGEEPTFTLTVSVSGNGEVSADSGTISGCTEAGGSACEGEFAEGAHVVLTENPGEGQQFAGWDTPQCDESTEATCEVVIGSGDEAVSASFEPEAPPGVPLTVAIEEGEGTVVSSPAGIECTGAALQSCETEAIEAGSVTLTASPAPGYAFKNWRHCDKKSGEFGINGRQCVIDLSEAREVGANFTAVDSLTLSKASGSGPGQLNTKPGGIACTYNCQSATASFKHGSQVTVVEKPAKHFHFVELTGGTGSAASCNGSSSETCTFTISGASSIEARFAEDPRHALTIAKSGGGQALIKTKGPGIVCSYTCSSGSASFYEGETVEVRWKLAKGTSSLEWGTGSGTCTGTETEAEGACTVTMSAARSLSAQLE